MAFAGRTGSLRSERAERRYRAVEPENRLVLALWKLTGKIVSMTWHPQKPNLCRGKVNVTSTLTDEQRKRIRSLGDDLMRVWEAPTTTSRPQGTASNAVGGSQHHDREGQPQRPSDLALAGRICLGNSTSTSNAATHTYPTDEDTIDLVRRLLCIITRRRHRGIVNRQGRHTPMGTFHANKIVTCAGIWKIPRFDPATTPRKGNWLLSRSAQTTGSPPPPCTAGFLMAAIAGEQITPGAPWQNPQTEQLRALFVENAPQSYVPMLEATNLLAFPDRPCCSVVKARRAPPPPCTLRKEKRSPNHVLNMQPTLFDNPS